MQFLYALIIFKDLQILFEYKLHFKPISNSFLITFHQTKKILNFKFKMSTINNEFIVTISRWWKNSGITELSEGYSVDQESNILVLYFKLIYIMLLIYL